MTLKQAEEIRGQRQNVYGSPEQMAKQVAEIWIALLRAHNPQLTDVKFAIPAHLVDLMMAGLKLYRCAMPTLKPDNDSYVDLYNYVQFAEEIDPTIQGP